MKLLLTLIAVVAVTGSAFGAQKKEHPVKHPTQTVMSFFTHLFR